MIEDKRVPPEVDVDPLGDMMLDFLIDHDNEEPFVDFKETVSVAKDAPFAKIAKDVFAFSNYGGGFFLVGFKRRPRTDDQDTEKKERRNYLPVGLPEGFNVDQADLQQKFNAYAESPIQIQYREFSKDYEGLARKLAAIYVPPSTSVLKPVKNGDYVDAKGRSKVAFKAGTVLFRRGTQSIVASNEETSLIAARAEKAGYRLSVLSGEPDRVQETLHSNLFEVTELPETIFVAEAKPRVQGQPNGTLEAPKVAVYIMRNNKVITFDDLTEPDCPLQSLIDPLSVREEEFQGWLADDDKQRMVADLLNKELRFHSEGIGLLHEPQKEKFFFACPKEVREESWRPRFKTTSTLTVAKKIWASQLKRPIYWHVAVIARFTYINNGLFLMLSPTIQLTDDGYVAVFGPKEGTVITRLTYNRYNSTYLNSLLFWISKLAAGKEVLPLSQGRVKVSAKPVECKLDVGILADRPVGEPIEEPPQIELGEGDS